MQDISVQNALLFGFGLLSLIGIILYFIKDRRNNSYAVLAVAFLLLGIASALRMEWGAIAAFLLSVIAARHFKAKFDKK